MSLVYKHAKTKGEFAKIVRTQVEAQQRLGYDILDHTVGGNCVALAIEMDSDKYRMNANTKCAVALELIKDMEDYDLVGAYKTVASGWKVDTSNRSHSPRKRLYLYRE